MAIEETDKRYLKIICIASVAFVGFLAAYSFFMPVWVVAEPYRPTGIGHPHNFRDISSEQLDGMPLLNEIVLDTSTRQTYEKGHSIRAVSEQDWSTVTNQLELDAEYDYTIIRYEDEAIIIWWTHSFIPPSIDSERR